MTDRDRTDAFEGRFYPTYLAADVAARLYVCRDCGVAVMDLGVHDEWHLASEEPK